MLASRLRKPSLKISTVKVLLWLFAVGIALLPLRAYAQGCLPVWTFYVGSGNFLGSDVPCPLSSIANLEASWLKGTPTATSVTVTTTGPGLGLQNGLFWILITTYGTTQTSQGLYYAQANFVCASGQDQTQTGVASCVSPSFNLERLGGVTSSSCGCSPGQVTRGEPIDVASGNVTYSAIDYQTSGANKLALIRYYNSTVNFNSASSWFGIGWRTNYDRYVTISGNNISVEREDGKVFPFSGNGTTWFSNSDVDLVLSQQGTGVGSIWTLRMHDDSVETYTQTTSIAAALTQIKYRNGYTQTISYGSGGLIATVVDSYGRSLNFRKYPSGILVDTPDGATVEYTFQYGPYGQWLTSVANSQSAGYSIQYNSTTSPYAMTDIFDSSSRKFRSWTYDSFGRGLTSVDGDSNLTTIVYNDADGSRTVTNALGVTELYQFASLQGVPKVTQIARAATSTTTAATRSFTYDTNGYLASSTDWNGNKTTYVNNNQGDPTSITEADGSSISRKTSIAYDATWIHQPATVVADGVTTAYTYDANGNVATRTLTDTTNNSTPYSTKGQTRTWSYTWSNGLLATSQTPNKNKTTFGYDGSGALVSTTDPLGHVTQITSHTGGGLPLVTVDPNGVTTTMTYDIRDRPATKIVSGTTGTYETYWTFDNDGDLITYDPPDGAFTNSTFDASHRVTKLADRIGNYVVYAYDSLGDKTNTSVYKSDGTLMAQTSGTFDALGRELVETRGAGQTTTRTYDANGNVSSVQDGLGNTTTTLFDALNRPVTVTDANKGVTTSAYDSHDRLVQVTDANGNSTSYMRDGFGDVIELTSPDSGVATYYYDADANLTNKKDALGIATNQTFDALDRPVTTTYPAHPVENVAFTYDQTGTGFSFGVGRLTSVTDAAGSLTRTYEERGLLASETRVNGATTTVTGYTYDGAGRIATLTYPDTTLITYTHDELGNTSGVSATLPGASTATKIATLTHMPFGPANAVSYGNGISESWSFDQSYRATNITDTLTGNNLQNLTYAYDVADNVKTITDAVNGANTQTFGYDSLNRLASAVSGTGGYGSFAWTYDNVGNRLTQVQGKTTTTYGYTPGTNRLASINSVTTNTSVTTSKLRKPANPGNWAFTNQPHVTPAIQPVVSSTPPTHAFSSPGAKAVGWTMLTVGIFGLAGFRKRLLSNRLLGLATLTVCVSGGTTLLIGCGNGTISTPSNPVTPTAATPVFTPVSGTYTSAQSVTISDSTANSTIYYTTDGSTPTANSTKYTGAISVSSTTTLSAIAIASGYLNSSVASATYTITPTAATPVLSPASGTFTTTQSITITDTTAGKVIYYTTDGFTPTSSSTKYAGAISVPATETIQAIAVASGYLNSAVATATYTITPPAATPVFVPSGGTFTAAQSVTITDATPGASIFYTTDGTTPTSGSTKYAGTITVSSTATLKAIATATGYTSSAVATASFTINLTAAVPTFSPLGGSYSSYQSVTISDSTAGAAIYYTTDGSIPTVNSPRYATPITVTTSETISAIAVASGYANSAVGTAAYVINLPIVATPKLSLAAGIYTSAQTLTITDSTTGAAIYYTTDGSTPTANSTLYSSGIPISATETVQAIAIASGYANSAVASAIYTINPTVTTPTFSPSGGTYTAAQNVTISDTTPGASIYYTTDGSTPSASSQPYKNAIPVGSTETINAIGVAQGFANSAVASSTYTINIPCQNTVQTNANGNITNIATADGSCAVFTYNNANRAASVTGVSLSTSYIYDYAGQRYSKTSGGLPATTFSYMQDGTLIAENDGGTVTDYVYVDGRPIATILPSATPAANQINYLLTDHLGTPQTVANSNGAIVWSAIYQPFGVTNTISTNVTQDLRLPGQLVDYETGFNYNTNRIYIPGLGRYLETDPIGIAGGTNTYLYALARPGILVDPEGLLSLSGFFQIAKKAISATNGAPINTIYSSVVGNAKDAFLNARKSGVPFMDAFTIAAEEGSVWGSLEAWQLLVGAWAGQNIVYPETRSFFNHVWGGGYDGLLDSMLNGVQDVSELFGQDANLGHCDPRANIVPIEDSSITPLLDSAPLTWFFANVWGLDYRPSKHLPKAAPADITNYEQGRGVYWP